MDARGKRNVAVCCVLLAHWGLTRSRPFLVVSVMGILYEAALAAEVEHDRTHRKLLSLAIAGLVVYDFSIIWTSFSLFLTVIVTSCALNLARASLEVTSAHMVRLVQGPRA